MVKPLKILLINTKSKAGFILLVSLIIFGILGQFFTPYNPNRYEFTGGLGPSYAHLLGTTIYGQDVFSQLFYGAAPTLMVGFAVGIIGTSISIIVGISAGFASERVNAFITGLIKWCIGYTVFRFQLMKIRGIDAPATFSQYCKINGLGWISRHKSWQNKI